MINLLALDVEEETQDMNIDARVQLAVDDVEKRAEGMDAFDRLRYFSLLKLRVRRLAQDSYDAASVRRLAYDAALDAFNDTLEDEEGNQ